MSSSRPQGASTRRPPSPRKAFTLIELVVSIGITSILALIIFGILSQAMGVWADTLDESDVTRRANRVLDALASDLSSFRTYEGENAWMEFYRGGATDLKDSRFGTYKTSKLYFIASTKDGPEDAESPKEQLRAIAWELKRINFGTTTNPQDGFILSRALMDAGNTFLGPMQQVLHFDSLEVLVATSLRGGFSGLSLPTWKTIDHGRSVNIDEDWLDEPANIFATDIIDIKFTFTALDGSTGQSVLITAENFAVLSGDILLLKGLDGSYPPATPPADPVNPDTDPDSDTDPDTDPDSDPDDPAANPPALVATEAERDEIAAEDDKANALDDAITKATAAFAALRDATPWYAPNPARVTAARDAIAAAIDAYEAAYPPDPDPDPDATYAAYVAAARPLADNFDALTSSRRSLWNRIQPPALVAAAAALDAHNVLTKARNDRVTAAYDAARTAAYADAHAAALAATPDPDATLAEYVAEALRLASPPGPALFATDPAAYAAALDAFAAAHHAARVISSLASQAPEPPAYTPTDPPDLAAQTTYDIAKAAYDLAQAAIADPAAAYASAYADVYARKAALAADPAADAIARGFAAKAAGVGAGPADDLNWRDLTAAAKTAAEADIEAALVATPTPTDPDPDPVKAKLKDLHKDAAKDQIKALRDTFNAAEAAPADIAVRDALTKAMHAARDAEPPDLALADALEEQRADVSSRMNNPGINLTRAERYTLVPAQAAYDAVRDAYATHRTNALTAATNAVAAAAATPPPPTPAPTPSPPPPPPPPPPFEAELLQNHSIRQVDITLKLLTPEGSKLIRSIPTSGTLAERTAAFDAIVKQHSMTFTRRVNLVAFKLGF